MPDNAYHHGFGRANNAKKIIVINPATKVIETVANDVQPNDLIVSKAGFIYYTDTGAGAVVKVPPYSLTMSSRWSGLSAMPLGLLIPPATTGGRGRLRAAVGTFTTAPAPVSV